MAKYFDRFPLVSYNDSVVKNILTRVDFTAATKKDIYSKFDYVLDEVIHRPDLISDTYYGSPYYDWMIFMQNNIVDPYHDFYKSESDLQKMILTKYGSIDAAVNVIKYYRNNWAIDDSLISESTYDSLNTNIKKYYKPKIDLNNRVIGYSRIQEDWIRSTNKIIEIKVTEDIIDNYNVTDIIIQSSSESRATVVQKDSTNHILTLQHIQGEFQLSDAVLEINEGPVDPITNKLLWQPISDDEAPFWSPVTAYDFETENNALKRYVSIIKSEYLQDIDKMFNQQVSL